mmetsp:Transcript_65072/g.190886  ORF Transcript_65072/g.190886 Transcript_65072/m.190886 type:complete len:250 (+) Transcript_65072:769-1518(+)
MAPHAGSGLLGGGRHEPLDRFALVQPGLAGRRADRLLGHGGDGSGPPQAGERGAPAEDGARGRGLVRAARGLGRGLVRGPPDDVRGGPGPREPGGSLRRRVPGDHPRPPRVPRHLVPGQGPAPVPYAERPDGRADPGGVRGLRRKVLRVAERDRGRGGLRLRRHPRRDGDHRRPRAGAAALRAVRPRPDVRLDPLPGGRRAPAAGHRGSPDGQHPAARPGRRHHQLGNAGLPVSVSSQHADPRAIDAPD